jgi:hypothetical protein
MRTGALAAIMLFLATTAAFCQSDSDIIALYRRAQPQCAVATVPAEHELIFAGAAEAQILTNILFEGAKEEAGLVVVEVERGSKPVTLAIAAQRDVIWQVTGARDRVAHVIVLVNDYARQTAVTGIAAGRVSFADVTPCHSVAWDPAIRDAAENPKGWTMFGVFFDRRPDKVIAVNDAASASIPSGQLARAGAAERRGVLFEERSSTGTEKYRLSFGADGRARVVGRVGGPPVTPEEEEMEELANAYSGGIRKLDAAAVVSAAPFRTSTRFEK